MSTLAHLAHLATAVSPHSCSVSDGGRRVIITRSDGAELDITEGSRTYLVIRSDAWRPQGKHSVSDSLDGVATVVGDFLTPRGRS